MMPRVKFDHPPVVEVICSALFGTTQPIRAADIALYWQSVKTEFPYLEEVPPLPAVIEQSNQVAFHEISFASLPPLRRSWLISEDGRHILQLQEDRFVFNWKRVAPHDDYPSYDVVIDQFERYLSGFLKFIEILGIAEPKFRQFELTYVNHIDSFNGLSVTGPGGLLIDHKRDNSFDRFLPEPDMINWSTAYLLPESAGRLHVIAQTALSAIHSERIVRLDLSARGPSADTSAEGRRKWFDVAHLWITHGFVDATAPLLHQQQFWGKIA